MSEMFDDRHQRSFPIILSDNERERREQKKRKAQLEAEQAVEASPASYGVFVPGVSEWAKRVNEAPKSEDIPKSRFLPNPAWHCTSCNKSINNKPGPECKNPNHAQNYEGKLSKQRRKH